MRKSFIKTIIFIVLLQPIFINFTYVEALGWSNSQPPVCNWPSEMMSYYFKFQREMKSVLLWSDVQERRFNASVWTWWLFGKWSLKLPSAVDLVASSIWSNAKSTVSMAGTSVVLLMLAAKSVFQSNTEWFAILFKDRPIVRDYRTMLDIETDLFDVAYFRSKQMNLTVPLDKEETYNKLSAIIEKYQWLWLLYKWSKMQKTETLAGILEELVTMNTAMKHFILFWWDPWDRALGNYYWCFWNTSLEECKNNPILKFDSKAIEQLKDDYSWLWTFGACNLSFSNFKNSIKKSINNNSASVKSSFNDVRIAMDNLKLALLGNVDNWKGGTKSNDNRCSLLTDYEIAQLRAYWWPDWTCDERVKVSDQMLKTMDFMKNKLAQVKQRMKNGTLLKKSSATNMVTSDAESYKRLKWDDINLEKFEVLGSTRERENLWKRLYWSDDRYNPEMLIDFGKKLTDDYTQIMLEYNQSQRNAASSDLSTQLKKIKWVLEQVKTTIRSSGKVPGKVREKWLEYRLKKVAAKQCVS